MYNVLKIYDDSNEYVCTNDKIQYIFRDLIKKIIISACASRTEEIQIQ